MNVLFLCTGNSARSILAEVIFNDLFSEHGCAFSAGSQPIGKINPVALSLLEKNAHTIQGLKSQSIHDFTDEKAPSIDLLISVCDNASNDCPVWCGNGDPKRLHWSLPDPATVEDTEEKDKAFEETYKILMERIAETVRQHCPEKKRHA